MSDYVCPNCGADLGEQSGFDPNEGYWTCTECGQFLTDPNDYTGTEQFDGVGWFCDGCGAYLNKQSGFSDWYNTWTCTECGYENRISEDEIRDSYDYSNSESMTEYDSSSEDDTDEDDDDDYSEDDEEEYEDDCYEQSSYTDTSGNNFSGNVDNSFIKRLLDKDGKSETEDSNEEFLKRFQEGIDRREKVLQEIRAERAAKEREQNAREREEQKRLRKEQRARFWRTLTRKKQKTNISSEQCIGVPHHEVVELLRKQEFTNINTIADEDLEFSDISKEGTVKSITINGVDNFDSTSNFTFGSKIKIVYHTLKQGKSPFSSHSVRKQDIDDVVWEYTNEGFVNIRENEIQDIVTGWIIPDGAVEKVTIDGKSEFKHKERFRIDVPIVIWYHTLKNK